MVDEGTLRAVEGRVFATDQTATHDGPGVRMVVYLKGCPLRCVWCHSPESQRAAGEIVWYPAKCLRCGACVEACPEGVRSLKGDGAPVEDCTLCGRCLDVCEHQGLEQKGAVTTAGAVADQALRYRKFYDRGRGGVTLSGGEPTLQPEFATAVLRLVHAAGLHTAIETTGFVEWDVLAQLSPVVDLFLYDVKHADPNLHERDTGVTNELILDNLGRLCEQGSEVLVRVPCIPGRNGTPEIIGAIAAEVAARGGRRISLLPYNPAAPGKYAWLSRDFALAGTKPQTKREFRELEQAAAAAGLELVAP